VQLTHSRLTVGFVMNRVCNGIQCGGVNLLIRQWLNIIAHRYRFLRLHVNTAPVIPSCYLYLLRVWHPSGNYYKIIQAIPVPPSTTEPTP
jgi:hypothetical protein